MSTRSAAAADAARPPAAPKPAPTGEQGAGEQGGDEEARSRRVQRAEQPLYASRVKVYPKAVYGPWRRIKWAVLAFCLAVYYLVPWLRWDRGPGAPDQAVLIDLPGRRAYFLWIEIWPQEVYFVTGLLILAALSLFLASAVLGRVWCGYACPQTVWTDLFMLVERLIEGDRNQRIRLDRQPWSAGKIARKAAKHAAWLAIAAATGGAWILYFVDAPTNIGPILSGEGGAATYFFVALFTTTTYLLAGWAREQVCTYMCPWPRFQSAMLDENSIVVTYRRWRGEPRGKHRQGASWEGRGDCVDCMQCVAACPTGIDIRDGQQLECIGCGLCIDACDDIMRKVGRPPRLIAWDTLASQSVEAAGGHAPPRLVRPRTLIYAALIAVVGVVMLTALALRASVEMTVQRDRSPLWVMLADGRIRNAYTVKLLNKTRDEHVYVLSVDGLADAVVTLSEGEAAEIVARGDAVATRRVLVTLPAGAVLPESTPIVFRAAPRDGGETAHHDSVFLAPRR
ncbi:MAG: cytochrome c oxidase accessory protein CcoG [Alphaproteobacteria bacterium]